MKKEKNMQDRPKTVMLYSTGSGTQEEQAV